MVINYQMLTETYHFLQSLSKAYPWIDNLTFREKFVKQMDILGEKDFNMRQFDVLLAQARFNRRFSDNYDVNQITVPTGICRFMFIELLMKMSKYLYSSDHHTTAEERYEMKLNDHTSESVKVDAAFFMMIKLKLIPFYKKMKIGQKLFRDNFMKHPDIEVVFTMNERAIRMIYQKKSLQNRDTKLKPHNADWMVLEDCQTLIRDDSQLDMPQKLVS